MIFIEIYTRQTNLEHNQFCIHSFPSIINIPIKQCSNTSYHDLLTEKYKFTIYIVRNIRCNESEIAINTFIQILFHLNIFLSVLLLTGRSVFIRLVECFALVISRGLITL